MLLALSAGCTLEVTAGPLDDRAAATATPEASASTPVFADQAADDLPEGITATLDAVAAAFLAADPEALRPWLADPDSAFGRAWLARAANLAGVPLRHYALRPDPALPDLATEAVRARHDGEVRVVYVVEEHALEGADGDGPAAEDLFLTLVERDGRWLVASDRDAEPLGLVSVDHLWDHGPVVATRDVPFLALHHPGSARTVATVLSEARAALADLGDSWPLPWERSVPLIVPRDEAELGELLHVTFDLSDFVAFATATPNGELGEFRLTGARIVLNTPRFLDRSPEARRRILAHELLHVATRPYAGPFTPSWVEEGLAQRLGERRSTTGTDLLGALAGRFDGTPPEDADFTTGGTDRIFLSYQLAWSFADFLADRYGEARLATFYEALGRGSVGQPGSVDHHLDRAARQVFGAPLEQLQRAWAATLRRGGP